MSTILTTAIELIQGDDYKAADSRAIIFTSATGWPVLTGAAVVLRVGGFKDYNFSVTNATTVTRDFTAAETVLLTAGRYDYQLIATLTNGDVVTIAQGLLSDDVDGGFIIKARIPPAS